jgi:hypothetical protein
MTSETSHALIDEHRHGEESCKQTRFPEGVQAPNVPAHQSEDDSKEKRRNSDAENALRERQGAVIAQLRGERHCPRSGKSQLRRGEYCQVGVKRDPLASRSPPPGAPGAI